jgi:hypothetical protein
MTLILNRVAECRQALANVLTALADVATDDIELLGDAIVALDDLRGDLLVTRDAVERNFIEAMGDLPEIDVNGALLEVRRSDSRKAWNHKDLAADLASRLVQMSVDMDTGEIIKTPEELLREVITYAGVSYWKVKALNSVGISADDYCEVTEGGMKVRIKRL